MGLIPDDVIHEIRARADIVAVIGQHVGLRKAGRNHKGLCPFHNEKTPSFNVNGDKGFFYCFGCHKKGDVFTFVMEYEGKSFMEAAESLARRFGVTIPERRESPVAQRERDERGRMLEVNALAAEFFRSTLLDEQRGAPGREYLASRGIDAPTSEAFRLGYAPDDWHALSSFLAERRVPAELAIQVGLLVRQPRAGGVYDRFRGRLMCPVILPGGEIAGFSGRLLPGVTSAPGRDGDGGDGDGQKAAKYINSPESPVYKKSKLLFGLHRAREAFRRTNRALLVEGNFDVIHLHQAGFDHAVAPLGTALTDEQIGLLRRLAPEVVLLYDGDEAGRKASMKALDALIGLMNADVGVRIVSLPPGQDPDGMLAGGRADELTTLIERAQDGVGYFIHEVWAQNTASAEGRSKALGEAARLLAHVTNPTKRDLIMGTLAAAMDLDLALVERAVNRGRQSREAADRRAGEPPGPGPGPGNDARPAPRPSGPRPPREELDILSILADHPELMQAAEEQDVLSFLTDARLRDMYCAARQGSPMLSAAPEDIGPLIAEHVLAGTYASVEDPAHCLAEAVNRLRQRRSRSRLVQLQKQAQDARRRGDVALERRLFREILTTRRQVD
jgi:DNA primase